MRIQTNDHIRPNQLSFCSLAFLAYAGLAFVFGAMICKSGVAQTVKPKVEIGRDTTYVTGPLTDDGYIDYVAHLNQMLSKNVTPENNAAVLLLKASPGEINSEEYLQRYCKALGIRPVPLEGDYFLNMYQFVLKEQEASKGRKLTPAEKNKFSNEFFESQNEATKKPWTANQFPKVKKWLDVNREPLELVRKASLRKEYYHPMLCGTGDEDDKQNLLVAVLLPQVQSSRSYARALAARAMLHAGEGDFEKCTEDLLTMRRLGNLIAKGATLIEQLVGMAIGGIAQSAEVKIALSGAFSGDQLMKYRERMDQARMKVDVVRCFGECERLMYLDSVQHVMKGGIGSLEQVLGNGAGGPNGHAQTQMRELINKFVAGSTDWSETMRVGNRLYDEYIKKTENATWQEQLQAHRELDQELRDLAAETQGASGVLKAVLGGPEYRGKMMGKIFCTLLMPALGAASGAQYRTVTMDDLSYITLEIVAYKDRHGDYPESLDDSKGKLPVDGFSEKPFRYRRKGEGFLLYSVGPNGKDENGNSVFQPKRDEGDDYGVGYETLQPKAATR